MIYIFPLLLVIIYGAFLTLQRESRRDRQSPVDLGWAFLTTVFIYGLVPGIGFLLAYVGVGEIRDERISGNLDIDYIEPIELAYICFVIGFAVFYSVFRSYSRPVFHHKESAFRMRNAVLLVALVFVCGAPIAKMAIGVKSADDYIGSYAELRTLPLIVQQLFGIADQLQFSALLASVVFAVAAAPRRHWVVALALLLYVVYSSFSGGSRAQAFLCFFAYVVSASIYVKDFSMARIAMLGAPALVLFMIGGLIRDNNPDGGLLDLFQSGEFTALFINAVDLRQRFEDGYAAEFRFAFYLVDVIRLIPSQLLGDFKIDPATWYVETFYPDYFDAGGGLAFGLMAESAAGFGAPEAFLRGLLLGWAYAALANRLTRNGSSILKIYIYVWLVVMSYQSFRDTTFTLITRSLYQVIPVVLFVSFVERRASGVIGARN